MSSLIKVLDLRAIVDASTDEELVRGLSDAEAHQTTPFKQLQQLRVFGFPRLAEKIGDPDGEIAAWASRMTVRYASDVVILNPGTDLAYPLSWIPALAVIRYGEAPNHWPSHWTDEDRARAARWESGGKGIPAMVSGRSTLTATLT